MTVDGVREICRRLPGVTEDVKWVKDLCFSVGGKMFTVVCLEPPHSIAFKCTPEEFGDLTTRVGIIPAPYMARNMWVQEQELGNALDRRELERLIAGSYELVKSKLPKSKQPGRTAPSAGTRSRGQRVSRRSVKRRAAAGKRKRRA
jgi:predicted DNA-binding protein (MmcQ/YjbR family)